MATITLSVIVQNAATVATLFDKIKIYRSITGLTGTYVEISTPLTRITIESTKTVYEYIDGTGDDAYFYKVSYFNTTTLAESSLSEAIQGEGDSALDLMSIQTLKETFLFGVDFTNDQGVPLPDNVYAFYIRSAVSWLEIYLDIYLRPVIVKDERHDYYPMDHRDGGFFIKLDHVPVISIEKIDFVVPNNQKVLTFDPAWTTFDPDAGHVDVIPSSNSVPIIGVPWLGWSPMGLNLRRRLPQVFRIDYTSGFAKGKCPPVILEAVGKIASLGPFNIFGDLIAGAGIASYSLSLDGLSQSVSTTSSATNAGYGARIIQYQKDLKTQLPALRRAFHPVGMVVV